MLATCLSSSPKVKGNGPGGSGYSSLLLTSPAKKPRRSRCCGLFSSSELQVFLEIFCLHGVRWNRERCRELASPEHITSL